MVKSEKFSKAEGTAFLSVEHAEDIRYEAEMMLTRINMGLGIGAVSSLCSLIGFTCRGMSAMLLAGIALAFAAYIIAGGSELALNPAKRIRFSVRPVMPLPLSLITGLINVICTVFLIFCVPVFFLSEPYRNTKETISSAEEYINCN